jgi:hypothetical protein
MRLPLLLALFLLALTPSRTGPTLTVLPSVGLAPLAIRVTGSTPLKPADRLIEIVAVLDADPAVVTHRTQHDVEAGRAMQTVSAHWTLEAGTYAVVLCVTGQAQGRCVERPVVAR